MGSRLILNGISQSANALRRQQTVFAMNALACALPVQAGTTLPLASRGRRYSSSSSSSANSKPAKSARIKKINNLETGEQESQPAKKLQVTVPSTDHISRSNLAFDSFFAGYRPVYLDKASQKNSPYHKSSTAFADAFEHDIEAEYGYENYDLPFGATSIAGTELDPVMKTLPEHVLDQMRSFRPPPPPGTEPELEPEPEFESDRLMANVEAGTKVLELRFESTDSAVSDILSNYRCFIVVNPKPDAIESIKQGIVPSSSSSSSSLSTSVIVMNADGQIVARKNRKTVFANEDMQMTSVLRKRRLKMKKHKLRKRRKAQRFEKRKLEK
ncbi:hypothetical protein V1514DRAFT_330319 [Lipomyces japonicus]|uniref:mitochondrial 37S ribosomal protein mS38 n=1 Tax=Lipomyces japonicus TaxID=56871 RepID=UPI0034CF6878